MGIWQEKLVGVFRDFSGWYHVVISLDTTKTTVTDGLKIYVNGTQQTGLTGTIWNQNHDSNINSTVAQYLGSDTTAANRFFDGAMSQVYFIDGLVLGPSYFGFTDPLTNTWRPKKFKAEGTTINDGTVWSNLLSAGSRSGYPITNAFDGNMSTSAQGVFGSSSDQTLDLSGKNIFVKNNIAIYSSSSLRYCINSGETVNYSEGSNEWRVIPFSGRLTSLRISSGSSGGRYKFHGVAIDGVIMIDSTTQNIAYGTNGFYLPMDGNSPIGHDKSNPNPINNGTTWSSGISGTSGGSAVTVTTPGNAFDGSVSTRATFTHSAGQDSIITWTVPGGGISGSTFRIYCYQPQGTSGANQYLSINGGTYAADTSWNGVSANADGWSASQTIPGGTLTSIALKLSYGGASSQSLYAVEVDGVVLVDNMYGNGWTPVNFGGSVALDNPQVSGARPILNTDGGGNVARVGVRTDAYHANLVLALPLVGSANDISNSVNSGSTTKTITVTNAVASSAVSNFYNGSWYFDGSGDYINASSNSDFTFGTGDFTIEGWVYPTANDANKTVFSTNWGANGSILITFSHPSAGGAGKFGFFDYTSSNGSPKVTTSNAYPINTWHHVAFVRNGTSHKFYINGIEDGTAGYSASDLTRDAFIFGAVYTNGTETFNGYMSDVRVYKGVAKYTSDFVVPSTSPDILPDTPSGVSGGSKLAKITDGAVSFDGTGDYLLSGASSDNNLGTGNFTIEGYIYPNSASGTQGIMGIGNAVSPACQIFYNVSNSQKVRFNVTDGTAIESTGTAPAKAWSHFAVVREGTGSNETKIYINGKLEAQGTISTNLTETTLQIGRPNTSSGTEYFNGFISNFRVIKGTALYTANFTPPTRELTNVTNTKLLCCQSNTSANLAGVSPGVVYSSGIAGSQDNTNGGGSAAAFDGQLGNEDGFGSYPNAGQSLTWTPANSALGTTLAYSSTIRVYVNVDTNGDAGGLTVIGANGSQTVDAGSAGGRYVDISAATSPITSIAWPRAGSGSQGITLVAVEVDGTTLIDGLAGKAIARGGDAAATTFNPFTTDINAVRGQESGYTTLNPLDILSNATLSDGNLKWTCDNNAAGTVRANIFVDSGKWYWEVTVDNGNRFHAGVLKSEVALLTDDAGTGTTNWAFRSDGYKVYNGSESSINSGTSVQAIGNVIQLAYDADNGSIWFGGNGHWFEGNPSALSSPSYTGVTGTAGLSPFLSRRTSDNGASINFGQKPFKFPPPDGFQSLKLASIRPETVARPDQYFGVKLYTGNDANVDFDPRTIHLPITPDLIWVKNRGSETTRGTYVFDTTKAENRNTVLNQDWSEDQFVYKAYTSSARSTYGRIISIGHNSFSVKGGTQNGRGVGASSNDSYVVWFWKAGGSKNTFNVDDVGYASAGDVGFDVGGQNNNAYDRSQTWSNSFTSSNGFWSGQGATKAFDGQGNVSGTNSNGVLTFSPNLTIPANSTIEVKCSTQSNGYTVTVNGVANDFDDSNVFTVVNYDGSTTLSTITIANKGSASGDLRGIKINGRLLVDNGVSVTNVPSIANNKASVGTKQGFSIVEWTGTNAAATISHGLLRAPNFYIVKNLEANSIDWRVYHGSLAADEGLVLNSDAAKVTGNSTWWNNTRPTSSAFSVANDSGTNGSGNRMMAYLWHDVPGLQKFGSYEGNESTDGPYVKLGFRPAILLVKNADEAGNDWKIYDAARNPNNPVTQVLYPNTSGVEDANTGVDFLSDGFKWRDSGSAQNGAETIIYAAWAEAPIANLYGGHSNAR